MLEDFVYFNNTAFSSLSLCLTLGFRFKISEKSIQQHAKQITTNFSFLTTPPICYVKLLTMSNTREFNFPCYFALFTWMKNNLLRNTLHQISTFYSVKQKQGKSCRYGKKGRFDVTEIKSRSSRTETWVTKKKHPPQQS